MATIDKRVTRGGKVRWDVRIRRRDHPVVTQAFSTKADAEAWARAAERDLDLGQYKPKPKQTRTLAEAISEFNAKSRKIASQHDREQRLAWWSEHFGKTPLRSVTATLLNEALQQLGSEVVGRPKCRRHRSPQTIRHYAIALSKCLSWSTRYAWALLLARICEVFPLRCANCGGTMRIIAFITDAPRRARHPRSPRWADHATLRNAGPRPATVGYAARRAARL
jgi:hypothetical protein